MIATCLDRTWTVCLSPLRVNAPASDATMICAADVVLSADDSAAEGRCVNTHNDFLEERFLAESSPFLSQ